MQRHLHLLLAEVVAEEVVVVGAVAEARAIGPAATRPHLSPPYAHNRPRAIGNHPLLAISSQNRDSKMLTMMRPPRR
jgi:hypothetical protein